MSESTNVELDRIAAESQAAIDAVPAAGTVPGAAAAPAVDPAEAMAGEIAGLLGALVGVLSPAFPCLPTIYTEQSIGAASASFAAVCVKRGWLTGGIMGEYGEEIAALIVCGPLAVATFQGVKGDLARLKKKTPAAPAALDAGPPAEAAPAFAGPTADVAAA